MANYLISELYHQAEKYGYREFYRAKPIGGETWESTSWSDFFETVKKAGRALYVSGAEELGKAILCGPNCAELLVAEYGCFFNRMVSVPIYSYSSAAQFSYIARQCEAKVIFVGGAGQYELAYKYCEDNPGAIHLIVIIDNHIPSRIPEGVKVVSWDNFIATGDNPDLKSHVLERIRRGTPDDIASLIYTSGTTGMPKGVILTHTHSSNRRLKYT